MRSLRTLFAPLVLALTLPAFADIQAPPPSLDTITILDKTATIVAIDRVSRYVTLKGEQGRLFTVRVGSEVKDLDQIKRGDQVNVRYYQSLGVEVLPAGQETTAAGPVVTNELVTTEPGSVTGSAAIRQVRAKVEILSIDPYKKTISVREVGGGNWREVLLSAPHLQHYLKDLKEGETVEVVFTEAVAIEIEPR